MHYKIWSNCTVSEYQPYNLDDKIVFYNVGYNEDDGTEHLLSTFTCLSEAYEERDRLNDNLKRDQLQIEFRSDLRNI